MATTDQLLELDGISQRAEECRFELLDSSNSRIGEVHPFEYAAVAHAATGDIKRRISNFHLPADEAADVNTLEHRVRPFWVLENGQRFDLGIFLFADAANVRMPWGVELDAALFDQGLILAQDLSTNLSFEPGTNVADAIVAVAAAAGITNVVIDSTATTLQGSPLTFAATRGSNYAKAIDHLCAIAGFHPAYFTSAGPLRARTAVIDPASVTAAFVYTSGDRDGNRIIESSITEANDLLKGPNRYIAVDTTATGSAVSATYDLPASAPHSVAKRRFAIPRHIDAPGVGTAEAALVVAQNAAAQDPKAFEEVAFSSPVDPRHESFDVVGYDPEGTGNVINFLELEWAITLGPGGPMTHKLRRVYL